VQGREDAQSTQEGVQRTQNEIQSAQKGVQGTKRKAEEWPPSVAPLHQHGFWPVDDSQEESLTQLDLLEGLEDTPLDLELNLGCFDPEMRPSPPPLPPSSLRTPELLVPPQRFAPSSPLAGSQGAPGDTPGTPWLRFSH